MAARVAKDSIQADALWKEYDFVSSLIPLYRGFEMQAMHLAIGIFTLAAGFAASALEQGNWELVFFVGALLPWPLSLVLLVVATMEMRLVRASRWIRSAEAPNVLWEAGPSQGKPVIQWEAEPNRYLTGSLAKFKTLTEAWTYAAVIGVPGLLGGITGLVGGLVILRHRVALLVISILGLIALLGMALLVTWISRVHEERREAVGGASPTSVAGGSNVRKA
jgi:hypothetical protein